MRLISNPDGPVDSMEFSGDGRWLSAGFRVWPMPTGEGRVLREGEGSLRLAGPGEALVMWRYGLCRVTVPRGMVQGTWTEDLLYARGVCLSTATGLVAVQMGGDRVYTWNWPGLKEVSRWKPDGPVCIKDIALSPDGRHLALVDSRPRVHLYEVAGSRAWAADPKGRDDSGRLCWSSTLR